MYIGYIVGNGPASSLHLQCIVSTPRMTVLAKAISISSEIISDWFSQQLLFMLYFAALSINENAYRLIIKIDAE